jgi:hypothetical protein
MRDSRIQQAVPTSGGTSTSNLPPESQVELQATPIRLRTTDVKGKEKSVAVEEPGLSLEDEGQPESQLESQETGIVATDIKEQGTSVNAEASGVSSSWKGVKLFAERGKNLFEATNLRPEKCLLAQWKTSGRQVVDRRLRGLHLGQNIITNLRLSMLGSIPDEGSMKPTILIVCSDERKIKEIDTCLREFIKISFPDFVEFKVVAGRVKLAGGPENNQQPAARNMFLSELEVFVLPASCSTVVGSGMKIVKHQLPSWHPEFSNSTAATMGGIITVGDSMYGLTVAHALFRNADKNYFFGQAKPFGWVKSFEWSGYDNSTASSTQRDGIETLAMDWMLIRLREEFMLPNLYLTSEHGVAQDINGFTRNFELRDGEVWVCTGFTRPQIGILDSTPSSIIINQVSYEVLSIALEFPLGMCNATPS